MKDYIPTSPFLFRIIKRAMVLLVGVLLLLAVIVPAPLQDPGNLEKSPNPVKAAWFFLWIQELASYSTNMIYIIMLLGICFFLLPYLPGISESEQARWMPKDQQWVNIVTVFIFLCILALTVVAMFFRGTNWGFVSLL
ncbi:MAG: selenite/tellurite reduction operon b-type cytochrome membrane protein ExtQ [Desulfobacterales bacterium]